MSKRNAAVPGVLMATAALLSAGCSESRVLEPEALAPPAVELFRAGAMDPAAFPGGIDAHFARIAEQVPGFAGYFYNEAGALTVVMAGGASAAPLRAELGAFAVQEGDYDFIQLDQAHRQVRPVLGIGGVVFTDADEAANRVRIGVENAAAAADVEHALAMLGVPREIVVISETEPIETLQTLQDRVRPVGGALQINWPGIPGFVCTLGFNVRSPGAPSVHGFVTNSHCTSTRGVVTGTTYYQHRQDFPDTFIGVEAHDIPFFQTPPCPAGRNCRYSDAAGVRYEAGVDNLLGAIYKTTTPSQHSPGPLTIDPVNPRWTITSETPFPTLGQTAHKSGRTTGWLVGPVIQTCINTNVSGPGNITMLCQDRVEATAAGGDSGSPVFLREGETLNVSLVGILWGGSANTYVLSSMQNVRCENEGPAPWITFPGQDPPGTPACTR